MASTTLYPSESTYLSNYSQSADHSSATRLNTTLLFYNATQSESNWETFTRINAQYAPPTADAAIVRFTRTNTLKYANITSATLHFSAYALDYSNTNVMQRHYVTAYTTENALSAVSWSNFKNGGVLGEWIIAGGSGYQESPLNASLNITSLFNGDLSANEFTLAIAAGGYTGSEDPSQHYDSYIPLNSVYLTVTYEAAPQPAPTPLYPKDMTLIESSSTLFSWQFNSTTAAVQTSAQFEWKNVNDSNYTVVNLTQSGYDYTLNQDLAPGSYQWRVKVTNDAGIASDYSAVATFNVVGRPSVPVINTPEDKALTTITWNTSNQQSYEFVLTDQSGIELIHETIAGSEASYKPNMFLSGQYLVSIRVMNDSLMWSDWAQKAFTISAAGPAAATMTVSTITNPFAVKVEYSLPADVRAFLMRSLDGKETIISEISLNLVTSEYIDDTVASDVTYEYFIRTYDAGYTDTAHVQASVHFDGAIFQTNESALRLSVSEDKFLPHSETIRRDYAINNFSGREFPMIERGEFTSVEISRRFYVTKAEKKLLDELCKVESVFYRDSKDNAFSAAIGGVQYESYMKDGYLATINLIRLYTEEVLINV